MRPSRERHALRTMCVSGCLAASFLLASLTWTLQLTSSSASPQSNDGEVVTQYGSYNSRGYNSYGGNYGGHGGGYGMDNYYLADFDEEWAKMSGRVQRPKCVDIPANLTLCQNIGYDKMTLPNLLQHDSLSEVTQQARSWVHLVGLHCHPDTQVFLCSLFSPVCLDREIYPCRTLCESVRDNCLQRMRHYGFGWPEMLHCDKFPEDNDMCIKLIHDVKPDSNCSACKHPMTYESIIDNSCRADFVVRVKIDKTEVRDGSDNRSLLLKKSKRFYKKENITKKDRSSMVPFLAGGNCSCDLLNDTNERFLLMGKKNGDDLVVNFVSVFQRKDKDFKRALKNIRKGNVCEGIIKQLTVVDSDKSGKPEKPADDGKCSACRLPAKYETIVENYCLADFVLRVSVTGIEAKDGHQALITKKRRKNFKKGAISRKEEKSLTPLLDGDEQCTCDLVSNTKARYLIFGNKRDDKFYVNYVTEFDKKNRDFKKGLKAIRKGTACLGLLHGTGGGVSDKGDDDDKKSKGRKGRKGKKRRKGKKKKKGKGKKNKKDKDNDNNNNDNGNGASAGQ